MKTICTCLLTLVYYSMFSQDVCPCQENNFSYNQYSWNQVEDEADVQMAFLITERTNIPVYELRQSRELIIDEPLPHVPETEEKPSIQPEKQVSSHSSRVISDKYRPKRSNPRFRKHKRKGKKKYRGKCPRI